jgi:hypothetical protein
MLWRTVSKSRCGRYGVFTPYADGAAGRNDAAVLNPARVQPVLRQGRGTVLDNQRWKDGPAVGGGEDGTQSGRLRMDLVF